MSEPLSDAEMNAIAERAADRAIEKVYEQIGKSVAQKVYWFIGVAVIGMLMLLAGHGVTKS
jgi:hypothetical protein